MPLVLVITSYVAASRVGAAPVVAALAARKIDPVVIPTTLLGRHPGWGPPGGGPVAPETMESMLDAIAAQGLLQQLDAVLAGYFASASQVDVAIAAIRAVRQTRPNALVLVDPILGDDGDGFYVKPEVAQAVTQTLVPLADLLTPNRFEFAHLTGEKTDDPATMIAAARRLGARVAVTSVAAGDALGAAWIDAAEAWLATAPRAPTAPNGTGDLFAGVLLAALLEGLPPAAALHRAVGVTADVVAKAKAWNAPELPIVAAHDSFTAPATPVALKRLE